MLEVELLDDFATELGSGASLRYGAAALRSRYPGISFSCCDAADMSGEEPYRRYGGFDFYLVDGSGHCAHLTDDPVQATGVIVAEKAARK